MVRSVGPMSGTSNELGSDAIHGLSAEELGAVLALVQLHNEREAVSALLLLSNGNTGSSSDKMGIQDPGPSNPQSDPDESKMKVKKVRPAPTHQPQGINFYKRIGRWTSHIWAEGRQHYLGSYPTATEAARAYDKASLKHFSGKAQLNFERSEYVAEIEEMAKFTNAEYRQHLTTCAKRSKSVHIAEGVTLCSKGWYEVKIRNAPVPRPANGKAKAPLRKWEYLGKFRTLEDANRCYQRATKKT